jgi:hypothetical protein
MDDNWEYQIRFKLNEQLAEAARHSRDDLDFAPIAEALARNRATAISTFDAFVAYVTEAERSGIEHFPLYQWTKATIEDPAKQAKHSVSFAVYVDGKEVYDKGQADALEADLAPLVAQGRIVSLSKHDANTDNNPQAPSNLRRRLSGRKEQAFRDLRLRPLSLELDFFVSVRKYS